MLVMHLLKTGDYSGAENVAITIIVEMRKRYNYRGIYVSVSGDINTVLEKNEIEHVIIAKNCKEEYEKVIDTYHPDVIHAHDFGTSVILAQIRSQALRISHLHNNPPWIKKINLKSVVYLWASKQFKYILSVSDSIFKEYVFGKLIRKKTEVIGNPVDTNKIKELSCMANEYEESDIIFLGRLSSQKNPLRFLHIVNECKKTKRDIRAVMIGKGELENEIETNLEQMNLKESIKMIGFKRNPYGYLKHSKVLCVPSDWEGFGLVIVEAFALGIPVVATPVGGIPQLVTAEAGFLSASVDLLCDEIIKLLSDQDYYNQKSKAALVRAAQLDNVEEYVEQFYMIYKRNNTL